MSWGLFVFLLIGTIGVETAAERRWPADRWLIRFAYYLVWALAFALTGSLPVVTWCTVLAATVCLIMAAAQPDPRRKPAAPQHRAQDADTDPGPAAEVVHHADLYPDARPLRRFQ